MPDDKPATHDLFCIVCKTTKVAIYEGDKPPLDCGLICSRAACIEKWETELAARVAVTDQPRP